MTIKGQLLNCCAAIGLAVVAMPALAETTLPAATASTPLPSQSVTQDVVPVQVATVAPTPTPAPTPVATVTPAPTTASTPAPTTTATPAPRTASAEPAATASATGDRGGVRHDAAPRVSGAFADLPRGERKIALSLYAAEPHHGAGTWSLDRIAAAGQHEGWGKVFHEMRADGLVHARNLGHLVSAEHRHEFAGHEAMRHQPHHFAETRGFEGGHEFHSQHHAPVIVSTGAGTAPAMGHHTHHAYAATTIATAGGTVSGTHAGHMGAATAAVTTTTTTTGATTTAGGAGGQHGWSRTR